MPDAPAAAQCVRAAGLASVLNDTSPYLQPAAMALVARCLPLQLGKASDVYAAAV